MNKKNLISLGDRPENERKKISRKGGIKSGQKRREKKRIREELEAILSNGDVQWSICVNLVKKAQEGNVKAFECIRDTLGENPKYQVERDKENDYE